MSDPSNLYALEDLRIISGYQITPVVATEDEIRNTQAKIFATGEQITKILEDAAGDGAEDDSGTWTSGSKPAPTRSRSSAS